jgi:hypothetical protein
VFAAKGSHASYDSCALQKRSKAPAGLIDDRPQCDPTRQLALEPEITPLSDLALAPWACWQGRFGHATRGKHLPVVAEAFADGPLSPLWQQRFGAPAAAPCNAVRDQPQRPPVGEEVLSDGVGDELRAHAGRLGKLFDDCSDWAKPPASGVYVVACNETALNDFFESGLTDPGEAKVGIGTEPPGVPAVYRRPDATSPDGLPIEAAAKTTVSVYAACYHGRDPVVARFPAVAIEPGHPVVLRTGDPNWTIASAGASGAVAAPETSADSARCSG